MFQLTLIMMMMMMPSTTASSSRSCLLKLKTLLLLAALCGSASAANNIGRIDSVADIEGVGVGADPNPTKKVVFASPSSSSAATPQDAPVIVDRRNNRNLNLKKRYEGVFNWVEFESGSTKAAKAASSMSAEEKIAFHRRFDEDHASKLTSYLQANSSADHATDAEKEGREIITELNGYTELVRSMIAQSDSPTELVNLYGKLGWVCLTYVDILPEINRGFLLATAEDAFSRAHDIAKAENLEPFITTTALGLAVLFSQYAQDQAKAAAVAAEALEYVTEGSDVVPVGKIQFQAACSREEISAVDACSESEFALVPRGVEPCSLPQVFACELLKTFLVGEGEGEGDEHEQMTVAVILTYVVHSNGEITAEEISEVNIEGLTDQGQGVSKSNIVDNIGEVLELMSAEYSVFIIPWGQRVIYFSESEDTPQSQRRQVDITFSSLLDDTDFDDGLFALAIQASSYSVEPWATFLIGTVGGWIYIDWSTLLLKLKIDDAVGAVPVHFGNGMWGCIAVGLFAEPARTTNYGWFYNWGSLYDTAKSGVGISSTGVMNPGLVMRNIIPVVQAGVLGIYGVIIAVIIQGSIVVNILCTLDLHTWPAVFDLPIGMLLEMPV